ncbi:MAG: hypothetical protein HKN46_09785 [Acidimicrobiia bacterium]|nr:hypothetical protein [Acidimicrobiia bacterium]
MTTLRRTSWVALLMALLLVLAGCSTDTADTVADDSPLATTATEAPVETEAPTTTAAPAFDLEAAVVEYVSTIPEGWMSAGNLESFKEAVAAQDPFLLDVRQPGEYEEGHIPGAVNIPLRELGENIDMIPTDRPVIIYCKSGWRAGIGVSSLAMMGFDNVKAFGGGWNAWSGAEEEIETEANVAEVIGDPGFQPELVEAVAEFLATIPEGWLGAGDAQGVSDAIDAGAFVLDVREPGEYAEGHLPGAVNIPVRSLGSSDVELPTDQPIIEYCKSGYRASLVLPVLHMLGYDLTKGFSGSWLAWTEAGLPTEQ